MRKYRAGYSFSSALKFMVIGELALFGYSYYIWWKLCNKQDFRHHMYQKHPRILEGFYGVLERFDKKSVEMKQQDYKTWGVHR